MDDDSKDKIASIIGNRILASALYGSISLALNTSFVQLTSGKSVWHVFQNSLNAAIRNIENHPKGQLFRRLIEFGPYDPDEPKVLVSDSKTTLSDPECGTCVEFIFSHMVNRFKGELAELLALKPCISLIQELQEEKLLPSNVRLYWGKVIQERRRTVNKKSNDTSWGGFTKGADGLLVEEISHQISNPACYSILGIFEVKSMKQNIKRVFAQIDRHLIRLNGGVKIGERVYSPNNINLNVTNLLRVIVMPSTWNLSREWKSAKTDKGKEIVLSELTETPILDQWEEWSPNHWKVTLAWSQEALEQAAYEMTFWYMSQVGKHIYSLKSLPKGWEYMTPEQAGYNAIKMMLYYIPLRYISERQERLAIKLYNIYCFGYPLGVDSKEMLWPQDFPHRD